jgi:hypothetical protein
VTEETRPRLTFVPISVLMGRFFALVAGVMSSVIGCLLGP